MPRGRPRVLTDDERRYNKRRSGHITGWKKRGLVLPEGYSDWNDFHDRRYLGAKTCDGPGDGSKCAVVFGDPGITGKSGGREMEHCHDTEQFRGVCCRSCNNQRRWTLDDEPRLSEEEKAEYNRAWQAWYRAAHPEEVAAYRAANRDKRNARQLARYHAANPRTRAQKDAHNVKQNARHAANPRTRAQKDADNAKARARYAAKKANSA